MESDPPSELEELLDEEWGEMNDPSPVPLVDMGSRGGGEVVIEQVLEMK